jgi:hypothetical protein
VKSSLVPPPSPTTLLALALLHLPLHKQHMGIHPWVELDPGQLVGDIAGILAGDVEVAGARLHMHDAWGYGGAGVGEGDDVCE